LYKDTATVQGISIILINGKVKGKDLETGSVGVGERTS